MMHLVRTYLWSTQRRPDIVRNYFREKHVAYAAAFSTQLKETSVRVVGKRKILLVASAAVFVLLLAVFAVRSGSEWRDPKQPGYWISVLERDDDPAKREAAVGVLTAMANKYPEAIQPLSKAALKDTDASVRRAAVFSLSMAPNTRNVVEQALSDPHQSVREAATAVLSGNVVQD
jgi:HEAT repeat protein